MTWYWQSWQCCCIVIHLQLHDSMHCWWVIAAGCVLVGVISSCILLLLLVILVLLLIFHYRRVSFSRRKAAPPIYRGGYMRALNSEHVWGLVHLMCIPMNTWTVCNLLVTSWCCQLSTYHDNLVYFICCSLLVFCVLRYCYQFIIVVYHITVIRL